MAEQPRLTRASFLKLSAMAAVGTAVTALEGRVAEVAQAQGTYQEAPALAAQVAAGQLPPVAQRLPDNPYVPPHKWLTPGQYGGTLRLSLREPSDLENGRRIANYMYGHSPVRWLRDGLEIGPGLAERWESNADASQWTFYFRKGLKWSDGQPFTVDDIIFWWEDEVKVQALNELPPDETRSGKGTLANFVKVDDYTLRLEYDSPAPLTVDRLAMWVKRDPLGGGGRWSDPKHYLAPFHIKYNPSLDPNTWTQQYLQKREHRMNPECPVMTGWMVESVVPGQRQTYVRNPYFWAVDSAGNQLPYIDRIEATIFQDPEVMKLQVTSGAADFLQGNQAPNFTLADVQTLRQSEGRSGMEMRFWDNGGGTGTAYFFNWNSQDPKWRPLVRNTQFLKALSIGFNRTQIQQAIYFNTGELTTGTMSPKAIEYNINDEGRQIYALWRDSASKYDPEQAKAMLDAIGVKAGPDGMRTFPDGSPLEITLDYEATQPPAGEVVRKDEFMAKDWNAIGLKTTLNPVPYTGNAYYDAWEQGKLLTNAQWGVGDGPNHLVYPQWVVPIERQRWAPLNGNWYAIRGTPQENQQLDRPPLERTPPREPPDAGDAVDRIWKLYDQTKVEVDPLARHRLVWEMVKIHANEGPFWTGCVANTPYIILVKHGLMNVPQRDDLALHGFVGPWIHPTPAVFVPETWFWDNPGAH
jgi:peptide/nickel transport system substrate-binding protein